METVEAMRKSTHIVQKAEKIKAELKAARAELSTALERRSAVISDLQQQSERYSKLHSLASHAVTSFCVPVVGEMTALLEETAMAAAAATATNYSHGGLDAAGGGGGAGGTGAGGVGGGDALGATPDAVWEDLARIADRAVSRVVNASFGYHVSVVARRSDGADAPTGPTGPTGPGGQIYVRVYPPVRSQTRPHTFAIGGQNISYGNPAQYEGRLGGKAGGGGGGRGSSRHMVVSESSIIERCLRSGYGVSLSNELNSIFLDMYCSFCLLCLCCPCCLFCHAVCAVNAFTAATFVLTLPPPSLPPSPGVKVCGGSGRHDASG